MSSRTRPIRGIRRGRAARDPVPTRLGTAQCAWTGGARPCQPPARLSGPTCLSESGWGLPGLWDAIVCPSLVCGMPLCLCRRERRERMLCWCTCGQRATWSARQTSAALVLGQALSCTRRETAGTKSHWAKLCRPFNGIQNWSSMKLNRSRPNKGRLKSSNKGQAHTVLHIIMIDPTCASSPDLAYSGPGPGFKGGSRFAAKLQISQTARYLPQWHRLTVRHVIIGQVCKPIDVSSSPQAPGQACHYRSTAPC